MSSTAVDKDDVSDKPTSSAKTVTKIVMAEQITQDVVKEAQSVGNALPIDDTATTTKSSAGDGATSSDPTTTEPKPSQSSAAASPPATSTSLSQVDGKPVSDNVDGDVAAPAAHSAEQPNTTVIESNKTKPELVNGDSAEHSAVEDSAQHAPADASGGSDTDISRPGSVDPSKERPSGHLRANSLKKPASFKSVSVTKNFLAKSAVTAPSARPGEKGMSRVAKTDGAANHGVSAATPTGQTTATTLQTAKPRLVAKSGSGIGNAPRSSLKTNGVGSGPDASKVWNKNQPVPVPPPKQFTDEELKQQYGIHLATRLQADESGKEAKWADIDDDEDDWAPDTVQWMDGTKSTVTATENQPPPPEEPKPVVKKEAPVETRTEIRTETPKPTPSVSTNASRPSSTTGTKTILKPGVHTTSVKAGLVLKGQPDKPTLVAKPPAPATVKSPWAPLPPVEKVSPVQINPPVQQQPQQRFSRDAHGHDSMPPPPPPAATKEFAPDDFSRSWRDDRGNKELFNSHNGRYEPVKDMRRGSFRDSYRDGGFRQPSVLQRPAQDGPAEPSAAFQTSRTSAEGPAWGRRRNSSNVSAGSGRRMSFDRRPADIPPMMINIQRRESHSINGSEVLSPPLSSSAGFPSKAHPGEHASAGSDQNPSWTQSPNVANARPISPYGSVTSSTHIDSGPPSAQVPLESAVEVQNRLMREKLERARLQKQKEREEEERQEAEKKERLRKKLEALGITDSPKTAPKEQAPARGAEKSKSPNKDKAVPVQSSPPPKPPIPTSEGEVAQYGMMKVHQPHPVKKMTHGHDMNLAGQRQSRPAAAVDAPAKPSPSPAKEQTTEVQPSTTPAAVVKEKEAHQPSSPPPPPPSQQPSLNHAHNRDNHNSSQVSLNQQQSDAEVRAPALHKTAQPPAPHSVWSTSLPQQSRAPWSSLSTTPSSNVWGPPPTKERALGNGTFDSSYNRGQSRPPTHQVPSQPPASQPSAVDLHQPFNLSPAQPSSSQTQLVHPAMSVTVMAPPATQGKLGQKVSTSRGPGPIAPPPSTANRVDRIAGTSWGNFAQAIRERDQASRLQAEKNYEALGGAAFRPEIREVFKDRATKEKQITEMPLTGHPTLTSAAAATVNAKVEDAQPVIETTEVKPKDEVVKPATSTTNVAANIETPAPQAIINPAPHHQPSGQASRSSRFFPRPSEPSAQPGTSGKADSPPPPPETETHPVFSGNVEHPVVKMPKPAPVVRLPPAALEQQVSAPRENVASAPIPVRAPIASTQEWQARFNGLLGKTTPSTTVPASGLNGKGSVAAQAINRSKQNSLAIAASSKAPLEVRGGAASATVSLPASTKKPFVDDDSSDVNSRAIPEQVLLEEREFGSLPIVKLPTVPHLACNEPPAPAPPTLRPHQRVDRNREEVATVVPLDFIDDNKADTIEVRVCLPGMSAPVSKTIARPRAPPMYPPVDKAKRNNSNPSRNQRGRKSSNYNQNQGQGQGRTNQRSPRSSTAGGSGWGNSNTNSTRSTPSQTWNRRSAPVH